MKRAAPRDAGFTLLELVVALSIFALVAVMGLQGLTGLLRMRDGLEARADTAADLGRGLALLRADLTAALPMLFYPPGRATPQAALRLDQAADGPQLSLSVGGQPSLEGPGAPGQGLGRVDWRLDASSGELWRSSWAALTPADTTARGPEALVLTGVRALSLRSFRDNEGWVDGALPAGLPQVAQTPADSDEGQVAEVYSSTLPAGLEVTLELEGIGTITLIESLR